MKAFYLTAVVSGLSFLAVSYACATYLPSRFPGTEAIWAFALAFYVFRIMNYPFLVMVRRAYSDKDALAAFLNTYLYSDDMRRVRHSILVLNQLCGDRFGPYSDWASNISKAAIHWRRWIEDNYDRVEWDHDLKRYV